MNHAAKLHPHKRSMTSPFKPIHGILMVAFCLIGGLAFSQESSEKKGAPLKKPKFEIINFGTFAVGGMRRMPGQQTGNYVEEARIITTTNRIQIKRNLSFGIQYMITDTAESGILTVVHVLNHPLIINPETNESTNQRRRIIQLRSTNTGIFLWQFEEPYEFAPGSYVFSVYHKGEKVLEKSFLVTTPDETEKKP